MFLANPAQYLEFEPNKLSAIYFMCAQSRSSAVDFYPDWKCVAWVDRTVPTEVTDYLSAAGAILKKGDELGMGGMFWRFLVNDLQDCERYLIRDADSRICEREALAVREWEKSNRPFHIIRDHPHHNIPMCGGTWGAVKGAIPNMAQLIKEWTGTTEGFDADQQFLKAKIWPLAKDVALQHDSITSFSKSKGAIPLPSLLSYDNPRFVGEVFDAHDRPRSYEWEKMLMHVQSPQIKEEPKPLFIRPHLGLGDAFILNGMVRALATKHAGIIFPAKQHNAETLKMLWADVPNVAVIPVTNDSEADELTDSYAGTKLMLGMFGKDWNGGKPGWDELMYKQAGVPFEDRWSSFKIGTPPNVQHETSAKTFALVHHDIERNFVIQTKILPSIPSYYVWPSRSLLDFIWMIQNAEEIHCIDSSVACLADSIATKAKKLVLHLYARPGAKPPMYSKPWIILKK